MKLSQVTKVYHNKHSDVIALDKVSIDITHIGITAIIGPSGCGKTTLLYILGGRDCDFTGQREVQGHIEIVEQEIQLFESMSVIDNLKIVNNNLDEISKLLTLFKMNEHKNKNVKKLSLGQKKRVQFMRALLNHPDYLLCDEVTAALDYDNIQIVMNVLKKISKKISVIIVTHDISLVERFADHIIRMGKSQIESIDIDKKIPSYIPTPYKKNIPSFKQHLHCIEKMMKSRIWEQFLLITIVFMLCISIFSLGIFNSFNQTIDAKDKWRIGENIITPQPNEGNDVYKPISDDEYVYKESSTVYHYYDLYNDDDIRMVKDNINDVIGYDCGWNIEIFSQTGTWLPYISEYDAWNILQSAKQEAKETGQELSQFEKNLESYFKDKDLEDIKNSKKLFTDMTNLDLINEQTEVYTSSGMLALERLSNTKFFQIFDGKELPLQYGTWMKKDNEMVVPYNVALELAEIRDCYSVQDLIGMEFTFSLLKRKSRFDISEPYDVCTFQLTGISYYGNEDQNYFFVKEGVWDRIRSDFYEFEDHVNYQYIDFIVDDQKDSNKVANEIDQLLESKESHFVTKSGNQIVEEDYQNLYVILIFVGALCISIIATLFIIHIILKNREEKETRILLHYGYKCYLIKFIQIGFIFLLVGSIQLIFLPQICQSLNTFASSLGFQYVIDNDIKRYLTAWISSFFMILLIEFIFLKIQRNVR